MLKNIKKKKNVYIYIFFFFWTLQNVEIGQKKRPLFAINISFAKPVSRCEFHSPHATKEKEVRKKNICT